MPSLTSYSLLRSASCYRSLPSSLWQIHIRARRAQRNGMEFPRCGVDSRRHEATHTVIQGPRSGGRSSAKSGAHLRAGVGVSLASASRIFSPGSSDISSSKSLPASTLYCASKRAITNWTATEEATTQ